jgi:hypothetical protein
MAGLSRPTPGAWLSENSQVTRPSPGNFITEVTPSGGVLSISMQIGAWTWSAPTWSWTTVVYPPPAVVKTGIEYGPTGTEFTGTYAGGGGGGTLPPVMFDVATGKIIKTLGGSAAEIL